MSHLTKNKIIVYMAAIFLVGGVTGAVLGWTGAKERWWTRRMARRSATMSAIASNPSSI